MKENPKKMQKCENESEGSLISARIEIKNHLYKERRLVPWLLQLM